MFSRKNRGREYHDDDGHVIAPMNVEGMPWYRGGPVEGTFSSKSRESAYDRKETWAIIGGTLKAALLIAGAFLGVFFLFILLLCLAAG